VILEWETVCGCVAPQTTVVVVARVRADGAQSLTELLSERAVHDKVDRGVGADKQVTDMIVVEVGSVTHILVLYEEKQTLVDERWGLAGDEYDDNDDHD